MMSSRARFNKSNSSDTSTGSSNSNSEFKLDREFKLTFDNVYHQFVSVPRIDVFDGMMRSEYRTKCSKLPREQMIEKMKALKDRPKTLLTNSLNNPIEDPFAVLGFEQKTTIQDKVAQHANWMPYYGNYAYCCSCGAGKTVAGIHLIHKFQMKTLIISSRNAVNDQWFVLLHSMYPQLIIETKDGWHYKGKKLSQRQKDNLISEGYESDIMVCSPQYLVKYVDTYKLNAGLIIYDEVHALLSKEFIKVLLLPVYKVINNEIPELPLMVALSATYPNESTDDGRAATLRLNKLFGSVFRIPSSITNIPVNVWDYRDHFTRVDNKTGETLKGENALGTFDSRYYPLDDYQAIEFFCNKIQSERKIEITPKFKGIVMAYTIDSSAYIALYVHKFFNCNVVLIRAANEPCYYLECDKGLDYEFDDDVRMTTLLSSNAGTKVQAYQTVVNNCEIIVGTEQRLKEGFSVQNITWGICCKFPYSAIVRVQILGRIRRNSNDEELNKHERMMFVCSGTIPSTIGVPNYRGKHKVTYDMKTEEMLFKVENYNRI